MILIQVGQCKHFPGIDDINCIKIYLDLTQKRRKIILIFHVLVTCIVTRHEVVSTDAKEAVQGSHLHAINLTSEDWTLGRKENQDDDLRASFRCHTSNRDCLKYFH